MTVARSFIAALLGVTLAGCGVFGASSASSRPEPRRLHITLVGGSQLNPGPSGRPNPIQACLYVVRSAGWAPLGDAGDTKCAGARDDAVAASSRQVIAPNQVLQLSLDPATQDELWLLVDADYARRPPHYAPLRMHVDGGGLIHYAVWLDGDGIHDALRPGPVPIAAIAAAVGVAALAVGAAANGIPEAAGPAQGIAASRAMTPSRFGRSRPGSPSAAASASLASDPPVTHVMPNTIFRPIAPVAAPATSDQVQPPNDMTSRADKSVATGSVKPSSADFVIDKPDVRHIDGKAKHHLNRDLQRGDVQ